MADNHYDVIVGTGAGGGTLAHRLAPSGKRILLLERGGYVPREKQNWDSYAVEVENRYHIVDGSFFASSSAVNPALTIMANAMRVGDHLCARLG